MVARWFIEWVVGLVHFSDDAMVVGSILVKVVVLCSILLDQLLCQDQDLKKMANGHLGKHTMIFDSFDCSPKKLRIREVPLNPLSNLTRSAYHILQFCGVVVLPTHVIVDFVGIVRDVTDFFYVRSNCPIEPVVKHESS